jgi:proteasome accessory factor A
LVANDRAGQRLITRAVRELGLQESVSIYNNSIDHFGGHTFGCHENFLARIDEDFFSTTVVYLYGFLVTRQIFAGVGRVGGHILTSDAHRPSYDEMMENPVDYIWVSQVYGVLEDHSVDFQLSQRADHILKTVASRVRFNRALINPKWEHFYSHDMLQRLHLLFGESNQNEYAYALKVGTTTLALRLAEDGLLDEHVLPLRPLIAMRIVSRDPNFEWPVEMVDGTEIRATDLQRRYLERAEIYRGESEETDWILDEWRDILDGLDKDPLALGDRVDWVAKRAIVDQYRESEDLTWQDDALHSVDLEYHNIDPEQSLFHALQSDGQTRRFVSELDIVDATIRPPTNTRALGRSQLVKKILEKKGRKYYLIDWNAVVADHREIHDLSDPFNNYDGIGRAEV